MKGIAKPTTVFLLVFLVAGFAGMSSTQQRMLSGGAIGGGP